MSRTTVITSLWVVFAVLVSSIGLAGAAAVVGTSRLLAVVFRPADPECATMAVVAREMKYDECSHQVSGKLERHYELNSTTPIDVTVIAYTPDGPPEGVRVTQRMASSGHMTIDLTGEAAAAFAHSEARKTVSLRRADGQLLFDEKPWPGW